MVSGDSPGGNRVEITDGDGWRKEFPLEKPLVYIGSDARNDIVLHTQRGGNVAPRHLQLVALPALQGGNRVSGYRAINLSDRDLAIGEVGGRTVSPRATVELDDGDRIRVGDFRLVFHMGTVEPGVSQSVAHAPGAVVEQAVRVQRDQGPVLPVRTPGGAERAITRIAPGEVECIGVEERSPHIGLKLSLPRTRLEPQFPLEGSIMLRNLGHEQGVQFRLEVAGLPQDCYQIGPGPILFPNVEKGVPLRLQHPRGPGMAAGPHEIRIVASAPDAYPGEEVCVTHDIEIVPYYHHTLVLTALD